MLLLALTAAAVAQVTPVPIVQLVGATTADTVQLGFTLNKESKPRPRSITWTLPKAVRIDPGGFARCSPKRSQQLACPRRAKVGSGRMTTVTGPEGDPLTYELKVFADGSRRLTFALRSPDLEGHRAVAIRGRKLRLRIPPTIRKGYGRTYLTNFSLELGPAAAGGRPFVTVGACRRHEYAVEVELSTTTAATTAESDC